MKTYDDGIRREKDDAEARRQKAADSAFMSLMVFVVSCTLLVVSSAVLFHLMCKHIQSKRQDGSLSQTDDVEKEVASLVKLVY